jgi:hypothetical protein
VVLFLKALVSFVVSFVVAPILRFIFMPIVRWAASDQPAAQVAAVSAGQYIEPVMFINRMVVLAAYNDDTQLFQDKPEFAQSVLNACLDSLRVEKLSTGIVTMFAALVANGLSPDEALLRCHANTLMLGMSVQRRLDSPDFPLNARDSSPSAASGS